MTTNSGAPAVDPWCWVNGTLMPLSSASVPCRDLTVLRGAGIFDFLRTYSEAPLLLPHSLERFRRSADLVGLRIPYDDETITAAVNLVLERNKSVYSGESGIRLLLSGGITLDGLTPHGTPSLIVISQPLSRYPAECYTNGVKAITAPMHRFIPEAKHLNYLPAVVLAQKAKQVGAVESIYMNPDTRVIYEGSVSNIFLVKNGVLITPQTGILLGITRKHILQLARTHGWAVEEREVHIDELLHADEAFFTAANKRVLPIVNVDGAVIGSGTVGPKTKAMMELFDNITINLKPKTSGL
ncbi:amino acid aminotransferase [Pelomyxa schiedti]|nr:amino acid aminotransferase [Pelomyxa schiedti]